MLKCTLKTDKSRTASLPLVISVLSSKHLKMVEERALYFRSLFIHTVFSFQIDLYLYRMLWKCYISRVYGLFANMEILQLQANQLSLKGTNVTDINMVMKKNSMQLQHDSELQFSCWFTSWLVSWLFGCMLGAEGTSTTAFTSFYSNFITVFGCLLFIEGIVWLGMVFCFFGTCWIILLFSQLF